MTLKWVQQQSSNCRGSPAVSLFLLLSLSAVFANATQEPQSKQQQEEQQVGHETVDHQEGMTAEKRGLAFSPQYVDPYLYSFYAPQEIDAESFRQIKRGAEDGAMPGVLRFGKRGQSFVRFGRSVMDPSIVMKKEMPGVLRFGKRSNEKKAVPGVLRFGKRDDIPGVLRFGKRGGDDIPGVLRFGKRDDIPGVLRFGKRDDIPGVLRFGKRGGDEMPGVLRFGKRDGDIPGVLRFGKRSGGDIPGVLRFGRR